MDKIKTVLEMYDDGVISESELLLHVGILIARRLTDAENAELDTLIRNIGDRETVAAEKRMHRSGHPIPAFEVPPFAPES